MAKTKTENKITDREKQVLSLLIDGYSNEEVGIYLNFHVEPSRRTEAELC